MSHHRRLHPPLVVIVGLGLLFLYLDMQLHLRVFQACRTQFSFWFCFHLVA